MITTEIGGSVLFLSCMKQYHVSHLLVFLQSHARLCCIGSFNEDQLVSLDVLQDALQPKQTKTQDCLPKYSYIS